MANRTASIIVAIAGLMGLCGVALAAAASHGGDPRLLGGASAMCLAHAPALVALGAHLDRLRLSALAAGLLAVGTIVFSADLVLRHIAGHGLFPLSAPTGGVLMILGWATLSVGALLPKQPK